jgi:putative membrane protein
MPEVQWLVTAFPNFVRYVVVGFALAALFLWIYTLITPWREFALIRAGNSAAATALVGALLGFSLPLANTIAHSVSLTDVVLWALVALVVQVIVHVGMRLVLPGLRQAIEANHAAAGIAAGGFAVCFGLINAACLTT